MNSLSKKAISVFVFILLVLSSLSCMSITPAQVVGTIVLSPVGAPVNSRVNFHLEGFPLHELVTVYFGSFFLLLEYTDRITGNLDVNFSVPSVSSIQPGAYIITAIDDEGDNATALFTVLPNNGNILTPTPTNNITQPTPTSTPTNTPSPENTTSSPTPAPTQTPSPTNQEKITIFIGNTTADFGVESNSTVSDLAFNSTSLSLTITVSGPTGTTGYLNASIAKSVVSNPDSIKAFVDGVMVNSVVSSEGDFWIIQINYHHSTHNIVVDLAYTPQEARSSTLAYIAAIVISAAILTIIAALLLFSRKKQATHQ